MISTISNHGDFAVLHDPRPVKQAMRARIRAERRQRPGYQREADAEALAALVLELPEIAMSGTVATYASTVAEPGTGPLRDALRRAGVRVLLPVSLSDGRLDWAEDDGELRPGNGPGGPGGPEPIGPRLGPAGIAAADVVIAPALAVDTLGNRLGQGAGYYDRALRLIEDWVPVIALVHEGEVLDAAIEAVPVEVHDLAVDAVVTPHRCLRLPPRR
jgi:5-formyltetrahydrofolate cyclo-ligase